MATARDIIADALAEIGVLAGSETPNAADANLALHRFQHMIDAWAADRLTLNLQLRTAFTMPANIATVTIGTAGADILLPRPVWISAINFVIPGSSPEVESVIAQMDSDAFAANAIKARPSTLPTQFYYDTSLTTVLGTVTFWPVVTQATKIYLYWPEALGVPASLNSVVIGPPGYQEALMYDLALRLWPPFRRPEPVPQDLQQMAQRAMATMKRQNIVPGLLSVDPALTGWPRGGAFNILTGN